MLPSLNFELRDTIFTMLSKIFGFGQKKREKKAHPSESDDDSWLENFHLTERGLPKFEKSQIRVLVFKDHDRTGNKCVMFDSKTAVRDESLQQNAEKGRPRSRTSSDAPLLGEMIFGSVEMTYKGPTVKVHSIRTPPQLLLTKVFAQKPTRATYSSTTQSSSECLQSSMRSSESMSGSISSLQSQNTSSDSEEQLVVNSVPVSMEMPSPNRSYQLQNVAEGLSNSLSASNHHGNATFPRTSSGSYRTRWQRSQFTRMDYCCQRRNESFNEEMSMRLRRRPKIGIGVLFSLWEDKVTSDENNRLFQNFCFSHFPVIESHVLQLKRRIDKALCHQGAVGSFQNGVLNAVEIFTDSFFNLYYAPRIRNPIWLTMLSQPDQCDTICEDLVPQLVNAIEMYNTKEKSFFMSSLVTSVLTYHVAWVTTVMPSSLQARRAYLDKHSSETLNVLGESHPYNPLWAQLSDLYGGCGDPSRIARTVVLGKDKNLVTVLLHILTYFIRCSEVFQQPVEQVPNFSTECSDTHPSSVFPNLTTNSTQAKSDNFSPVSEEKLEPDTKGENCDDCFEKTWCKQCNKLSVTVKDQTVQDSLFERSFEACNCDDMFPGNTKENRLWKSFLRTSCCDKACQNTNKDLKRSCEDSSNCRTLDGSCLSRNTFPKRTPVIGLESMAKLRRHSSENKPKGMNNAVLCVQRDGKTFSFDQQSILNMFMSSFPLCPICQGQIGDVSPKNGTVLNSSETGLCALCDKLKNCSCQMLNSEHNTENMCGSSTTVCSDYSSGISLQSLEVEAESLRSVSVDSGLNEDKDQICDGADSGLNEDKDQICDGAYLLELPEFGPPMHDKVETDSSPLECQLFSFGRSLMAGYCDQYLSDFVLHGTEVCPEEQAKHDLKVALEQPVVDSPVLESVLIVANTNNWTCTVKTQRKTRRESGICPSNGFHEKRGQFSHLVDDILTSFCNLWEINMSAQFCLMHLEDKMKEIYLRSKVISEYLLTQKKYVTMRDVMSTFGYGEQDLALLMSVIGVHSPSAISKIPVS